MSGKKELAKLEPLKRVENTDLLLCVALLSTRARWLAKAEDGASESELPAISCKRGQEPAP